MKNYEGYKNSGIEWMGEVPSHWELIRMRYLCDIETGDKDTENREDDGEYPFFVRSQTVERISTFTFDGEAILTAGDGVGVCKVWHYIDGKFDCHQRVYRLSNFRKVSGKFLFYFLRENFIKEVIKLSAKSTVDSLRMPMFQDFRVAFGTLDEQLTIVDFLDRKISQINTLISKKEKLIELLQEERTAIINQAVTKGLDPNVPMKDSGIEWLGKIPEHWQVKRLKYITADKKNAFVDGPFGSNLKTDHFIENGDVYVIDSGFITSGKFEYHRKFKTISKSHFETVRRSECGTNDIIISKIGANFGMSGILPQLDKPSLVSGNTLKLSVNTKRYNLNLIHLQLLNLKENGEIDLLVKGSAQPALSMGAMSTLPFVLPDDLDEQNQIVEYINDQHDRVDTLILKIRQEIELLKEYKTALIFEAVTGKIDVRQEALIES